MPTPGDKEEETSPIVVVEGQDVGEQASLPQESIPISPPTNVTSSRHTRRSQNHLEEAVLKFDNMKFVAGKGRRKKIIVQDVSAKVTKGHVLAIMGPSGAGKSTLISSLTLDAFYGNSFGSVLLNGVPLSDKLFKRYCYVVKQQDTNWSYLTARETLHFAAELYNVIIEDGKDATRHLVNDIICKMGLQSSADTKVARLSGGQQRRLSLAIALLKQPSILFLDEPTSGLDAASAAAIMREITRVAKEEGIIMVCTIHQPSSKVYNGFDQVMILSKGRLAFVGNASAASGYFQSIGYPLPPETNPAEHFLDLVNADFSSSQEVDFMLQKWKQTADESRASTTVARDTSDNYKVYQNTTHNIFHEVKVMFRRHALLMIRDPVLYAGRFLGFLTVNCVFGVVYIAAREYTQDQAVNKLWVSAWYIGVPSNFAVVAVYKLNMELKSIFIENKNGMGSAASYIVAKTILVTPILFLFAIAAIGVPGYLIQAFPAASFGRMILLWTVQIASWESSSEALAALFDDAVVGMMVHTGWWFLALLFSGYLVPLGDMFWPLKTFYYILPYSYYIRSAVYLIFTGETWEACTDPTTSAVCVDSTDGIAVLEGLDRIFPLISTEDVYWRDCGTLLAICLVWKIAAVVIIVVKAGRVSQIRDEKLGQEFITAPLRDGSYAAGQAQVDEEAISEVSFVC